MEFALIIWYRQEQLWKNTIIFNHVSTWLSSWNTTPPISRTFINVIFILHDRTGCFNKLFIKCSTEMEPIISCLISNMWITITETLHLRVQWTIFVKWKHKHKMQLELFLSTLFSTIRWTDPGIYGFIPYADNGHYWCLWRLCACMSHISCSYA